MPLRDNPAINQSSSRGTIAKFYSPNDQGAVFKQNANITMPDGTSWQSYTWDILSEGTPEIILSANTKFETPLNIEQVAGEINTLVVTQDSVGGRQASWGVAFDWDQSGEPLLCQIPGGRTILQFYCTGQHLLGQVFYKSPQGDYQQTSTI